MLMCGLCLPLSALQKAKQKAKSDVTAAGVCHDPGGFFCTTDAHDRVGLYQLFIDTD